MKNPSKTLKKAGIYSLALSVICGLSSAPTLSAQAETYNIRTSASVIVPSETDRHVAELLSEIISSQKANAMAVNYLKQKGVFHSEHVHASYYPSIAGALMTDGISYNSHINDNNPQVVHKIKISYDSTTFPDDLDKYYAKNYYLLTIIKRALDYNKKVALQAAHYLKRIKDTPNPQYQQLIRNQEGKQLFSLLKVTKWATDATTYMQRGKLDKAEDLLNKAIKAMPNYADLYTTRASLNTDLKVINGDKANYDSAIKDLNQAIKLQPKEAIFYSMRGNIYFAQGILIEESEKDFTKAIELDPELAWAYFMRGYASRARQFCIQPLKDFKKACDLGIKKACKITSCDS